MDFGILLGILIQAEDLVIVSTVGDCRGPSGRGPSECRGSSDCRGPGDCRGSSDCRGLSDIRGIMTAEAQIRDQMVAELLVTVDGLVPVEELDHASSDCRGFRYRWYDMLELVVVCGL